MPVPANTPGLTLGRALFDKRKFRADTDPAVIDCLAMLSMERAGAGWSGPAKGADEVYMAVYAQSDGGGAHNLYGGNPADPVNPYPLTVSASGSATVNWEEEGVLVLSSGTANFVGSGVTVTDVAGTATITITGGGGGTVTEAFKTIVVSGQSDIVADSATDTLTVAAGTGVVITTNAGTDTLTFAINTSTVAQNSFTTIAVSGQSNVVADSPTDTLTVVASTGMVITTNAGSDTLTFAIDPSAVAQYSFDTIAVSGQDDVVADSSSDTLTLVAGAGHTIETDAATDTITHKADVHNDSHVGLVDPTTGDDSTADDAQIGILWHEIASYDSAKNMLVGHAAGDTAKPVVEYKTVVDWLETIPDWDATKVQLLLNDGGNDGNEMRWLELKEVLKLLTGWTAGDLQSIGHDAAGDPEWQDDDDACP